MSFPPVTPADIAHAERIAAALIEAYPTKESETCYATAAHLLGHRDWAALVTAVNARSASAPFDEELAEEAFWARRTEQERILCAEMSGVDRLANLASADFNALPEVGSELIEARDLRRTRNAMRWAIRYAQELLFEIEPTAEQPLELPWYPNRMGLCEMAQLEAMPAALGEWWAANMYDPSPVSQTLRAWKFDPHRQVSILRLGRYWGTVCIDYAETLDWTMATGVSYVLAARYGAIRGLSSRDFTDAYDLLDDDAPETDAEDAYLKCRNVGRVGVREFYSAFPRDDFRLVFEAEPTVFAKSARKALDTLQTYVPPAKPDSAVPK